MVLMVVAVGWLYVVVLMAVAAVAGPQGSWLQGLLVLVFLGICPLAVVLYILATPARKRRLQHAQREGQAGDGDHASDGHGAPGQADEQACAPTSETGSEKTR